MLKMALLTGTVLGGQDSRAVCDNLRATVACYHQPFKVVAYHIHIVLKISDLANSGKFVVRRQVRQSIWKNLFY